MGEYREALLASTFTLCPGGGNIETYRIAEALEAGSIPIIETHADFEVIYPLHPMPYVRSFKADLHELLHELLQTNDGGGVGELQREVVRYWRELKADINRKFLAAFHTPRLRSPPGADECRGLKVVVTRSLAHLNATIFQAQSEKREMDQKREMENKKKEIVARRLDASKSLADADADTSRVSD